MAPLFPLANQTLRDLEWNGQQWVVVGSHGLVATSRDASSWTVHDSPTDANLRSLAWTGEAFVALGDGVIVVSTDGISWQTVVDGGQLNAVAGNTEAVVVVGNNGLMLRSEDLESWVPVDIGSSDDLIDVAADQDLFVVVADSPETPLLESPTGLQWTSAELAYQPYMVAATAKGFVVVAEYGLYWRGSNGSWAPDDRIDYWGDPIIDLALIDDESAVVISRSASYWYANGVWLPIHHTGSNGMLSAVEVGVAGVYFLGQHGLGQHGLSVLPIYQEQTPRRGRRVHRASAAVAPPARE